MRARRTPIQLDALRAALYAIVATIFPATVRQVYYAAVVAGLIDKTEAAYKLVCRNLAEMRLSGYLPFGWIADNTRWQRKPLSYSSLEEALKRTARTYRRAVFDSQEHYLEIWLEKEALSGVIFPETAEWDVPLMITRGYPSLSFLYEAAEVISARDQPTFLYYFGDHDPSGLDIERNLGDRLREFAPHADITLQRVGVTPAQIEAWSLPTRPTKQSDSRSRGFEGGSVEVDAIPPAQLRQLVRECIERHIDQRQLAILKETERSERAVLLSIAQEYAA